MRSALRYWITGLVGVLVWCGCGGDEGAALPARDAGLPDESGLQLVVRFAHVTDTHVIDEESPGRFAGAHALVRPAWRAAEAYSTQILDGTIRAANRIHAAGRQIDFLLHTGDACDNAQSNELAWFVAVMEGGAIDPRSGPDDRPVETRPPPELDPHAPFVAQGLYRQRQHGPRPSIPWYVVPGNHDVYSIGVFPIVEDIDGRRTAPLPLDWRPGYVLPVRLDPTASRAYGRVTPAEPGPPHLFGPPSEVVPNAVRVYFDKTAYVGALLGTTSGPVGHGLWGVGGGRTWYSVMPVAGLWLIGLDTTDRRPPPPGLVCSEGALTRGQLDWLDRELDLADERGEMVVVATHHPSDKLVVGLGSEVGPDDFRAVLSRHTSVVLHVAGHDHRNAVSQRAGYIEIRTCATIDPPQEARLIEIYHDPSAGRVEVAYEMFSHLDDALPALGDDPLRGLREAAQALAEADKGAAERGLATGAQDAEARGAPADRNARVRVR